MKPYALFPRTPGLFSSLNVQKNMLQDEVRNRAFKEAIFRNVKKGDVVIDLGTGTGILAIWAAQAGAKRVYAIEETDVAEVAEAVIKDNGFQNVITVLKANSSEVTLPEPADVLIAEVVGHFLFEEGIVEAIAGARDALLKPSGRTVPSSASVFVAPAELHGSFEELSFWDTWLEPRLSVVRTLAANSAYVETISPSALMAHPATIFYVDFSRVVPSQLTANVGFSIQKRGVVDAVIGWFRLSLDETSFIETAPGAEPTHWQQCLFPLDHPIAVEETDELEFVMSLDPFTQGSRWQWSVGRKGCHEREVHEFQITYGPGSRLMKERF
jgi:precorrin-6B methylase 2